MTPVDNEYFRLTAESLGETIALEAISSDSYYFEMVKTYASDILSWSENVERHIHRSDQFS
ncbi:MAG: hypothetical protein IPM59_10690 [Chloracidobacterium sp.]|nr:hypothetical protein [Chloracidobacterium sp.]